MAGLSPQETLEFLSPLIAFAILDENACYTFVSERWSKLTGYSPQQVMGRRVNEMIPSTMALKVYETGLPVSAHPVRIAGSTVFTKYIPRVSENGKVTGCFLYSIFYGQREVQVFEQQLHAIAEELDYYKEELSKERRAKYTLDSILGNSNAIRRLKEQIRQAAASSSTVLIEGETGTGKELIAHSIHGLSKRSAENLVRVNCSAIPEELMEAEFFGYTAGAFTGALKKGKVGRFLAANHGSLFLDEINLLPLTMQPKFLRALQEHEISPVGSTESIPVDVRIIAATNVPLSSMVAASKFRMDLYFRLNVIRIQAPPLRSHKEDIPLIAEHLIEGLNLKLGTYIRGIDGEGMDWLMDRSWPGNVRELQNCIEAGMNNCKSEILRKEDLMPSDGTSLLLKQHGKIPFHTAHTLKELKSEFEKSVIADTLKQNGGNKRRTAQILGISRTVLYDKIHEYGISDDGE